MIEKIIELQEKALELTLELYIKRTEGNEGAGSIIASTARIQVESLNILESLRDKRNKDSAVLKKIRENPYQDLRE